MPHNKSQTIKEQNRKARFTAKANELKPDKAEEFPASLNNIPKNEQ
jgi:hypothetical protein